MSCPSVGFNPGGHRDPSPAVQDQAPTHWRHSPLVAALADGLAWGIALATVVAGAGAWGDTEPPVPVEPWCTLAAAGAVLAAWPILGAAHSCAAGGAGGHAVREPLPRTARPLCRDRCRPQRRWARHRWAQHPLRGAHTGLWGACDQGTQAEIFGVPMANGFMPKQLGCT